MQCPTIVNRGKINMKKDLQKKGYGLMVYFTKKDCQNENLTEGDILDLSNLKVKRGKRK